MHEDILSTLQRVLAGDKEALTAETLLSLLEALAPESLEELLPPIDSGGEIRLPIAHFFNEEFLAFLADEAQPSDESGTSEASCLQRSPYGETSRIEETHDQIVFTPRMFRTAREAYVDFMKERDELHAQIWWEERRQEDEASSVLVARYKARKYERIDEPSYEEEVNHLEELMELSRDAWEREMEGGVEDDPSETWGEWDPPEPANIHEPELLRNLLESHAHELLRQSLRRKRFARDLRRTRRALVDMGVPNEFALAIAEAKLRAQDFLDENDRPSVDATSYVIPFCKQIECWFREYVMPHLLVELPSQVRSRLEKGLQKSDWTLCVMGRALSSLVIGAHGEWPERCAGRGVASLTREGPKQRIKLEDEGERQVVRKALATSIGGLERTAWIALCLEHIRVWYRNGYVHRDPATYGVVEAFYRTLFRPCRLLSFLATPGMQQPPDALKQELENVMIAQGGKVVPQRVWIEPDPRETRQTPRSGAERECAKMEWYEEMLEEWRLIGVFEDTTSGVLVTGKLDGGIRMRLAYMDASGQAVGRIRISRSPDGTEAMPDDDLPL